MSFSNTCKILFHSPCGVSVFHGGQIVMGTVQFTLNKPTKLKGVRLEIKGIGRTAWNEQQGYGNNRRTVSFWTREDYFKSESPLVGGADTMELAEGDHKFDFSFQLPPNLPSSFEGPVGFIRYSAKVIMDQPWKINKKYKIAFTVLSTLDLNTNPSYASPVIYNIQKSNTGFFASSGLLKMEILLPGTGFVPGQSIPIKLNVNNESKASVDGFVVHLTQLSVYTAVNPWPSAQLMKDKLTTVQIPEKIDGKSTKEIELSLDIPSTPPSTVMPSFVICISYYIKVIALVSGMHKNLEGKFNITIGTIPFCMPPGVISDTNQRYPYYECCDSSSTATLPPPTYEECMRSTERINDDDDDEACLQYEQGYRPIYPFYKKEKSLFLKPTNLNVSQN